MKKLSISEWFTWNCWNHVNRVWAWNSQYRTEVKCDSVNQRKLLFHVNFLWPWIHWHITIDSITTIWIAKTLSIRRSFLYRKLGLIFVEHQKMQCFPKIDLTMKWLKKFLMRLWHVKFQCFVHSSLSCQIKHDRWWCYHSMNHLTFMITTSTTTKFIFITNFFEIWSKEPNTSLGPNNLFKAPHDPSKEWISNFHQVVVVIATYFHLAKN